MFSSFSSYKSIFKTLSFHDREVSMGSLTGEIMLHFQIPVTQCGQGLNTKPKM